VALLLAVAAPLAAAVAAVNADADAMLGAKAAVAYLAANATATHTHEFGGARDPDGEAKKSSVSSNGVLVISTCPVPSVNVISSRRNRLSLFYSIFFN
jgi:hypothetical protein